MFLGEHPLFVIHNPKEVDVYEVDEKVVVARVDDYGPKPRGPKQALIQAHAFLAEEGQWMAGEFFRDGDPKEAYEKAACSSWAACSMGALGLVTGESPIRVIRELTSSEQTVEELWRDAVYYEKTALGLDAWTVENQEFIREHDEADYSFNFTDSYNQTETPVSYAAARVLAKVIDAEALDLGECPVDVVIQHNDRGGDQMSSRTRVLDAFADAIRKLGGEPLVDHNKVKNVRRYLARKRKAN